MKNTKLTDTQVEQLFDDLLDVFQAIAKDKQLLRAFLRDLLAPAEYRDTALRWRIIKMLSQNIPQREIAASLGVSLSKITRGVRELSDDSGGFAKVLKQFNPEK